MPTSSPVAAKELFLRGHDTPVGFACPKCGQLFLLSQSDLADEKQVKEMSERARLHCYRICSCGETITRPYWLRCDACIQKDEQRREEARFQRADKSSIDDYPDQPVFWDTRGPEHGYFADIAALLDYCEDEGLEVPGYVWAATPVDFHIDAERIIEDALQLQDHHENAREMITSEALKTLQGFLNVWAEEQKIRTWHLDHRRAVLLTPEDR